MVASMEPSELALRPTTIYVDLKQLRANLDAIRSHVGACRVMAIVKANAYGHGLIPTAQALERYGVDALGVAFLEEGVALRQAGVNIPILVLGGIIGNQIVHFLEYDLQITASSVFKVQQIDEIAAQIGKRAQIHLKIDTGMQRIGVQWQNAHQLFEAALSAKHCDVVGVFSHLAAAEAEDQAVTKLQIQRFDEALDYFPRHGHPMPIRHIANSAAIARYPESHYEMVRPGLLLYGVTPTAALQRTIDVEPTLSWKTRVVYFKVVKAGQSISYNGTWTAPQDTRVVTLPLGYGDGYGRSLSNCGEVLIHGERYPIVGTVTMDALMVSIGRDSAYNGDEVVLIGEQDKQRLRVEELAAWAGTIPYEILTSINVRVPRVYIP